MAAPAATPDGAFVLGVCGSAALYVLSYLPLGVASEFRYVYWAVLASAAGARGPACSPLLQRIRPARRMH